MGTKTPRVLLIAASPMGVSFLVTRLKKWECEIHFASSYKEANTFVGSQRFDLVLSEFKLSDGSSYPLADLLVGSNTTWSILIQWKLVAIGCLLLRMADHAGAHWRCGLVNSSSTSTTFSKRQDRVRLRLPKNPERLTPEESDYRASENQGSGSYSYPSGGQHSTRKLGTGEWIERDLPEKYAGDRLRTCPQRNPPRESQVRRSLLS